MSRKRQRQFRSSKQSKLSEARLRANRENAKKSTGPRTTEGKKRSSQNSISHGIYSAIFAEHTREEAKEGLFSEYTLLRRQYREFFRPETGPEEQLVDELVNVTWRRSQAYAEREELMDNELKPGVNRFMIEKRAEIFEKREQRLLVRSSRILRDLEFLSRWRKRRRDEDDDADSNFDPEDLPPFLIPPPNGGGDVKVHPPAPHVAPPSAGAVSDEEFEAEYQAFRAQMDEAAKTPSRAIIYNAPKHLSIANQAGKPPETPNPPSTLPATVENEPSHCWISTTPSNWDHGFLP